MCKINWKNAGTLSDNRIYKRAKKPKIMGVYLHVFSNDIPRLTYAGTSTDIFKRQQDHIENMIIGANTISEAPSRDIDIYNLMSIITTLDEHVHDIRKNILQLWRQTLEGSLMKVISLLKNLIN